MKPEKSNCNMGLEVLRATENHVKFFSLRKTLLAFFQGPPIFRSFVPKVSCPQAFVRFEAAILSQGFGAPPPLPHPCFRL